MSAVRAALITGANGFVPRNLIQRLRRDGWLVTTVSRTPMPGGVTWEQLWVADVRNIDAVFHLAAFIPGNIEDAMAATECVATNALLTLRLAEYIAANSSARFVYGSTGQVYRFQSDCVKECAPVDVTRRACFYLSSKLLGETYVERTRAIRKLNAVILRIGSCYGPLMPARALVARFVDMAKQRAPLTLLHGGLERFDMVYVDDVLELLVRAAASAERA